MDKRLAAAYDKLVPGDQLVIESMVTALCMKDKQIGDLVKHALRGLEEKGSESKSTD